MRQNKLHQYILERFLCVYFFVFKTPKIGGGTSNVSLVLFLIVFMAFTSKHVVVSSITSQCVYSYCCLFLGEAQIGDSWNTLPLGFRMSQF